MRYTFNSFIKDYWILMVLVAVKMVLHLLILNPVYELHRDEFLHLDQANHLAAGYISVPPLTSLVSLLIKLLGGGVFWIRFFPSFFGALTLIVIWMIVEQLKGGLLSKILVSIIFIFSVYTRVNILYQPTSFDILAWTAVFYFLIRYINEDRPLWLILMMIFFVLGWYNKYNIIFLFIGLSAGFLLTDLRKKLNIKSLIIIFLAGIILIIPNLLWQYNHQFPVVLHMRVLRESQLSHVDRIGFFKDQFVMLFCAIPLILTAFIGFLRSEPFRKYRIIGITFLITLSVFTLLRAKNYYALGLYPVLLPFGAVFLEALLKRKYKIVASGYLVLNLLFFFVVFSFMFPVLSPEKIHQKESQFKALGLLRWEDGKNHLLPQDFADMLGWKEMAAKTLSVYNNLPESEKKETLVFCDNYGQTGAVNFYNRGKMVEAYSFSTDYLFWIPDNLIIKNVILIGKLPAEKVQKMFDHFSRVGFIENPDSREKGTPIFLLQGAKPGFAEFFRAEIIRRRAEMDCF